MNSANKQTALKCALLVILAANVGSFSSGHKSHPVFHTTELARLAEVGTNGGGGSGATRAASASDKTTGKITDLKIVAAPSKADGPKPDAAVATATPAVKESTEFKEICSVKMKVHFVQKIEGTKAVVRAYVSQRFPQVEMQGLLEEGTYKDLIADPSSKAQWDETIHDIVVSKLQSQGKTCPNDVASSDESAPNPTAPATSQDPDKQARDQEIARGMRNCTLDRDAHPLKNSERFRCNLKRLENISLDRSEDDDQSDDSGRDSEGRRNRRRRDQRSSGLADVQSALRPLETAIKSLLLSSNQDKQDDGADHLDDVVSALETVRDTASSSADERAMNKLIDGLKKGYTLGAKVDHEGETYAARLGAIDDKISVLRTSMIGANYYQQAGISQAVDRLQVQRLNTQQLVSTNPDYFQLRALSQNGMLDQTDFTDFTSDYSRLLQQIQGGGAAGGLPQAPSDILTMRQQAQASGFRNFGQVNPAFPQINFDQLGLTNPNMSNGMNPGFNPGFNQNGPGQFGNQPNQFGNNTNSSGLTPAQQIAQMNGGMNNQSVMFGQQRPGGSAPGQQQFGPQYNSQGRF